MTKYLKQFELTAQYEEYINSNVALFPNVSVTNDDNKVHYNPIPNYLRFTAEEDNSTISLTSKTSPDIKYSLNGGTWTQWDYGAITLDMGDTVYIKGNNSGGFSTSSRNYNQFQMTGKISASGNIMSLLYEDNFEEQLTIPGEYCFYCMFYGCTALTTAPELPATTLANYCYRYMFRDCTSLTTAPELPATTLTILCYEYMFRGCTKLNYIKMLATNIRAIGCLYNWVNGVANTGTFIKHPNMTSLPTGTSGIPKGWTVQNAA